MQNKPSGVIGGDPCCREALQEPRYVPEEEERLTDAHRQMIDSLHAIENLLRKISLKVNSMRLECPGVVRELTWRDVVIRFGKNKGKRLSEIDLEYMVWLIDNFTCRPGVEWDRGFRKYLNQANRDLIVELNDIRMRDDMPDYEWIDPLDFGNN